MDKLTKTSTEDIGVRYRKRSMGVVGPPGEETSFKYLHLRLLIPLHQSTW